jgi:Domain of unknown function (DUF4178)
MAVQMKQMTCANCGASLEIENQFIRTVTCKFCKSSYLLRGTDGLDFTGQSSNLADYPSRLQVGMNGKIRGRAFTVLGRVRYNYDGGFWEEFQVAWTDGAPPDWLEEDEGYWTLFRRERVKSAVPPYDSLRVGSTFSVNNRNVFISEKRQAEVAGSEGQFASALPIKGLFGYVQGGSDNSSVSVNYWQDEIEISIGDELDHSDITFG